MRSSCLGLTTTLLLSLVVLACSGPNATSDTARFSDPSATETPAPNSDDNPGDPTEQSAAATSTPSSSGSGDETDSATQPTPTDENGQTTDQPQSNEPTVTDPLAPEPTPTPRATMAAGDSLFPDHRILTFYGHPSTPIMGILGAHSKEDALALLQEQAAEYEAADPDTEVLLAFELIATVAQPNPGDDGTYLLYTGDEWIGEYVEFAAEHDMLVVLDLQIGHDTIPNEINKIRKWLEYPHVHVALDPEFSTGPNEFLPGRAPGSFIGEVDGHDVQVAMEMLADIARENNLPNKVLIVHQFENEMIYNKDVITPIPGVDFVLDMDGFGSPEAKIGNYNVFVRQELIQWGGIKLFYEQDDPLIDPATIVDLEPPPMVIIYQ